MPDDLGEETEMHRTAMIGTGLVDRMTGPGGLYNLGNALGLFSGMALHVSAAMQHAPSALDGGIAAAWGYLAGSPGAVAITLSMLIFFWSGERYRAAWAGGVSPDPVQNRLGDLSSGLGALVLGLGLFLMGDPLLAATAGLMHAVGKFGSALSPAAKRALGVAPATFRRIVLASRVPAIIVVLMALAAPAGADAATGSLLLLGCYALWLRADFLLLRAGD
jgi:hypothetical protein